MLPGKMAHMHNIIFLLPHIRAYGQNAEHPGHVDCPGELHSTHE